MKRAQKIILGLVIVFFSTTFLRAMENRFITPEKAEQVLQTFRKSGLYTNLSSLPADKIYLMAKGVVGIATIGGVAYYLYESGQLEKVPAAVPFLLGSLGLAAAAAYNQGWLSDNKSLAAAAVGLAALAGYGLHSAWNYWNASPEEKTGTTLALGMEKITIPTPKLPGGSTILIDPRYKDTFRVYLQELSKNPQFSEHPYGLLSHALGENYDQFISYLTDFKSNPDQVNLDLMSRFLGLEAIEFNPRLIDQRPVSLNQRGPVIRSADLRLFLKRYMQELTKNPRVEVENEEGLMAGLGEENYREFSNLLQNFRQMLTKESFEALTGFLGLKEVKFIPQVKSVTQIKQEAFKSLSPQPERIEFKQPSCPIVPAGKPKFTPLRESMGGQFSGDIYKAPTKEQTGPYYGRIRDPLSSNRWR